VLQHSTNLPHWYVGQQGSEPLTTSTTWHDPQIGSSGVHPLGQTFGVQAMFWLSIHEQITHSFSLGTQLCPYCTKSKNFGLASLENLNKQNTNQHWLRTLTTTCAKVIKNKKVLWKGPTFWGGKKIWGGQNVWFRPSKYLFGIPPLKSQNDCWRYAKHFGGPWPLGALWLHLCSDVEGKKTTELKIPVDCVLNTSRKWFELKIPGESDSALLKIIPKA